MRFAVISDIHGNLDAFQSVLDDIDHLFINGIICLGDIIGYGAEPEQVIRLLRERQIPCVMGNHDQTAIDSKHLDWFNPVARESLEITLKNLSQSAIDFIKTLPPSIISYGFRFVHGFPPDSVNTYLFQVPESDIIDIFSRNNERICFVGHTHCLELIRVGHTHIERTILEQGIVKLKHSDRYIINVGSVGQPRDGNQDAKYLIYDQMNDTIEVRYIGYDIASAANKILAAGLPRAHADRLW